MTATAPQELMPGWREDELPLHEKLDRELLLRAYRFGEAAHRGQVRNSGDPYITHSVEVAKILAALQLDSITVASGLLHDVIEDTHLTLADVNAEFGAEIAGIVDGLTKIAKLPQGGSTQERQVESYRKLLLSIAKDLRVIIVKLADRLHNMRTLDWLPPEKRRRIAQETRDLYAPLAHRFGMAKLRWELEDLSFKHIESDEYKSLARKVAQKRGEREALIRQMADPLIERLAKAGIRGVDVTGRPKHLWSIYKKMKQREKPYEEIYDLLAIRVLVNSVPDCYHALGVIHDGWTPVQERIKDYIAQPKSNGYQSLHTTVFGPGKQFYEVQIRTRDMHRTADFGVAAHWRYKEDAKSDELDRHLSWFRQVLELQMDAKTPDEFLEFLKLDLYQDEIFVFTPTGDVIQLPKGATPLDFAFAVHTEIGLHSSGAKVNGRIAPLSRSLRNSETVEIITSTSAKPTRDWLAHVRTGRARHKIRQVLKREAQTSAEKLGQEMLDREVKRRKLAKPDDEQLSRAARELSLTDATHLLASIGQGDVNVTLALKHLYPDVESATEPPKPSVARALRRSGHAHIERRAHSGRRRADGALRAVLPAGPGRSGGRLRHARARREHPSRRLSESAAARARAGAPARDRLAGGAGRALPRAARARGQRPPRALRGRRRRPSAPRAPTSRAWISEAPTAGRSARCSSRSRTWSTSRRSSGRRAG